MRVLQKLKMKKKKKNSDVLNCPKTKEKKI